jgi:cell division transport system permease protein
LPPFSAALDGTESTDLRMTRALAILQDEPGIITAQPLARSEVAELLEPWLGSGNIVDNLPIPRLVDVVIDGNQPPNLERLADRLAEAVPGATLDDHTRWNDRILIFANFLRSIALTVLGLIALCTAAIVVFATRANLAAKEDVVEVLHLMGAHDRFIAREFQYEFLTVGIKGSILGVVIALITLLLTGELTQALVGTSGAYLIPANFLNLSILLPLIVIPAAAAGVIAVTTQMTVLNVLGKNL